MEKLAIHLKYINSRVTSFFGILGKANHRPYCADEVILTQSDDLVQPTIGWSSYTKKDAVSQWLSDGTINTPPSKSVPCWRSKNWHLNENYAYIIYIYKNMHIAIAQNNILAVLWKHWLPVSTKYWWILNNEQRLLIVNSDSAVQQRWPKVLMSTENWSRNLPYWRTFTLIICCFEKLRKLSTIWTVCCEI